MKIYALIALAFIAGILTSSLFTCDRKPKPDNNKLAELYTKANFQDQKIKHLGKKNENLTGVIEHLKSQKSKIAYRTKFDTLSTIDTVIVELIKCDSVVQLDTKIVTAQDSLIYNQTQIITAKDTIISIKDSLFLEEKTEHNATKKELKKVKRKLFFLKVATVAIIAGVIVIML